MAVHARVNPREVMDLRGALAKIFEGGGTRRTRRVVLQIVVVVEEVDARDRRLGDLVKHVGARAAQTDDGNPFAHQLLRHLARSEEHTSELQSLMRISYAVFCLNKTTPNTIHKKT